MYEVVFYSKPQKPSPITKFLNSCHTSLKVKILRQLKYLEEFGLSSAIPNIKKLSGTQIWELRILGKDNIRIFCTSNKKIIYVLHMFKKKSNKTPSRDLRLTLARQKELIDN